MSSFLALGVAAHAHGGRSAAAGAQSYPAEQTAPLATDAPAVSIRERQIVRASWYGGGERLNRRTSTGEIFHPMGHTAAHRTLPLGAMLRVTALSTGLSTIVRVNDRGPAAATGRALDLSRGAAIDLGIVGAGEARVIVEVMR
jgi:rare lipoprotein A (peptidoglycan hydrolase)